MAGHGGAAHRNDDTAASPPPAVAPGVELLGEMDGSGYREAPLLVRRADGQTIQLTPLLYGVLEAIDGRRTHGEIARLVATRTHRALTADDVAFLVDEKLRPIGVLADADGRDPVGARRSNPLLALRLRVVVTNPHITRRLTTPFALLFRRVLAVPMLVAFTVLTGWVLFDKGLGSPLHQTLYEPAMLLLVLALTIASAAFHEFGHAAACRYGGATPGAMGAALYLVWPVFFTDVTDSYRLGRAARLRVDVGGLYFNAIFAVATFAVWAGTRWDALLVLVPIQLFQMVRQLLPFVRFDGYHILADLVGVPDLFARIRPTLRGLLPNHWGDPATKALKPWARAVVSIWVCTVVPALALFLGVMVLALPRIVATALDSLRLQYAVLQENVADGDVVNVMVRVVSVVTIALTPLSIVYLFARMTRRTSMRAWRAAEGHPLARGGVTTALASVVAFALLSWWPGGQYAPVEARERAAAGDGFGILAGPVLDVGARRPAIDATSDDRLTVASGSRPTRSGDRTVTTSTGATEPRAMRSAVLTAGDHVDPDADPWPFPFARPPAPQPEDNFAVAVSTDDGDDVRDLAASLHWVDGERVAHRNRAYALASCSGCTTVASAFQVIVADDSAREVVPENRAVAVNYRCTSCVTHSIAIQLVVTTTSPPPDGVRRAVAARFADAEALEARADELSSAEVRTRLLAIRADILELLEPYALDVDRDTAIDGDQAAADSATSATSTTTSSTTSTSTTTTTSSSTTTTTTSTSTTTTAPSTTTTAPTATTAPPTTAPSG